jgi:hypothetical protein
MIQFLEHHRCLRNVYSIRPSAKDLNAFVLSLSMPNREHVCVCVCVYACMRVVCVYVRVCVCLCK